MLLSYDTETTGLARNRHAMFSYSTCTEDGKSSVYRLDGNALRQVVHLQELRKLWTDTSITKVMHNAHFDIGFTMRKLGMTLAEIRRQPIHDTSLMSRVLQNNHPNHRLKQLCKELFSFPVDDEQRIKPYLKNESNYSFCPESVFNLYQHRDAQRTMLLFHYFWPLLQANKDYLDIYNSELAVIYPTIAMEDRGVMIRRSACISLIQELESNIQTVTEQIEDDLGEHLRPGQDAYRYAFYKKIGIDYTSVTKTNTGKPKLSKEEVLALRESQPCEFIEHHLQYSSWTHGVAIIRSYLDLADSNDCLHPTINTCQATTGRQSCEDPNLQNVAKSRVQLNPYPVTARRCFRPRPGYVNFHLDYSGIEMRLLIHYSGDQELVDIANTPGGDVHLPATQIFFDWDADGVYTGAYTDQLDKTIKKMFRDAAKNCNFAKPYGAAVEKMAATTNLPLEEMRVKNALYEKRFPHLSHLNYKVSKEVRSQGFVWSAFGAKLYIPKEFAYIGLNYLIQRTAAEILKRSEPAVADWLEEQTSNEMQCLLPVHDELIIECPRKRLWDAHRVLQGCRERMVDFPGRFKVPLDVEADIATLDWDNKYKYSLINTK